MAKTLTLRCLRTGGGVTLVDGGRPGYQHLGVSPGGAADPHAYRIANMLLQRPATAPCLEITQTAGRWLLWGEGQFVLTGADMNWRLNGRLLEAGHVHYLSEDGLLTGTVARRGLRSYLALNGGWQLPTLLGSQAAGLPGISPIQTGWEVTVVQRQTAPFRSTLESTLLPAADPLPLAVFPGPEWSLLPSDLRYALLHSLFTIQPDSNRQGIRLKTAPFPRVTLPPQISSPVLPGTIQLTPSGPILLGPDAQTIGGYPRALLLADAQAQALVFQASIGSAVRFQLRTAQERHAH